jgi:hypothetical protein
VLPGLTLPEKVENLCGSPSARGVPNVPKWNFCRFVPKNQSFDRAMTIDLALVLCIIETAMSWNVASFSLQKSHKVSTVLQDWNVAMGDRMDP